VKPPDRKERELAEYYRHRVATDSFDERDVAALLITLRMVVRPNLVLFELGSFLAHRRRTRGNFHRFFASSVQASKTEQGLRLGMDAKPLYESEAILNSVNRALESFQLAPLPGTVTAAFVFCLISLLQDVTFEDEKDQRELGRIFVAFNAAEVFAMAAVRVGEKAEQLVPVLRTPNKWLKWQVPTDQSQEGTMLLAVPNEWLTVRSRGRALA